MEKVKDRYDKNADTLATLSKAGLYAPLSVFNKENDDATRPSKPKKLASFLKDGALVDFLVQVGTTNNRKGAISVGKNNGSKPLSQNEVNDRVRTKALTLVGGGINTSISGRANKTMAPLLPQNRASSKKRKRTSFASERSGVLDSQTWDTLERINKKWNEYIVRFLKEEGIDLESRNIRSLTRCVSQVVSQVEIVGSFVSIVKCRAHPHLVSKEGCLVGETCSTWRLATLPRETDKHKPDKRFCTVLTVPRGGGTELTMSVSFNPDENSSGENVGKAKLLKIGIK